MHPTRRDFLRLGLTGSTLLACGTTVPTFLARSAAALATGSKKTINDNVVVVLQLDGGNDGLNTVVPYADPEYRKHRPRVQVPGNQVLKINDSLGLHPALAGLAKLLENKQLAIVQNVGYPNPNRSHFESMAIWHAARLDPSGDSPGWLARYLDKPGLNSETVGKSKAKGGGDAPALHISESLLPQALFGSQRHVPSLSSLEQFRRRLGIPESVAAAEQRAALDQISRQDRGRPGSLLEFVERSTLITYASSARLEEVLNGKGKTAPTGYPEFYGLSRRLRLIAQLIKAGLTTSIYYTQIGGFDTHANQLGTHDFLLREVGDSLKAFVDDLNKSGESRRVLVLVFSEFGRRLTENASGGTDHGTSAPVLLFGGAVQAGPHGPNPNLQDLDKGGDPKHAIDFRQVYATVLDQWLGCPSQAVLGEKFGHLPVIGQA